MKNTLFALSAVLVLCAAAPPIREAALDFIEGQVKKADGWHLGSKDTAIKLDGVLYVDQRAGNAGSYGGCDGGVGLCYIGKGKLDYDFPALSGQNEVATSNVCAVSSSVTVTGCAFGDVLTLGVDQTVGAFLSLTPRMTAAGTAEVQACCNGINDAGSCDQGDSGYTIRCFR